MAERKPVYESIREAARRVGLSYDSLKRLADREVLRTYTVKGIRRVMVKREEVDALFTPSDNWREAA